MNTEIQKQELTSMNITEEQLQKLKQLFPEAFTEGNKIDWNKLRLTLGENIDVGKERFGMNWAGKADCFKTIQEPSIATLIPVPEESLNFKGEKYLENPLAPLTGGTQENQNNPINHGSDNLFIEGDNLEVLKLLQKSYLGKIKMIYIDPPYNTGNDFIYPDNYTENLDTYLEYTGQIDGEGRKFSTNTDTDGRFHSKWMNMMYPRLFLARNLLREDGVIFISIDDNEVHNLRALCNEIFGEENFVNQFVWKKNSSGKTVSKQFPTNIEYVLMYSKQTSELKFNVVYKPLAESTIKMYSKDDADGRGKYRLYPMQKTGSPGPETTYDYIDNTGKIWTCPEKGWRMIQSKMKILENDNRLVLQNSTISEKAYWNERENEGQAADTLWDDLDEGNIGTGEVRKLFNAYYFDYPKPTDLINRMISIGSTKNDIILDFFAGSCTTAHAVMELNKEDGGNRKFICVQLPEPTDENSEAYKAGYKTIAEISKERIRRVSARLNPLAPLTGGTKPPNPLKGELTPNPLKGGYKSQSSSSPLSGDLGVEEQESLFSETPPLGGRGASSSETPPVKGAGGYDLGFNVFKLAKSNFKIWDQNIEKTEQAMQLAIEEHEKHISPEATQEAILYELLLKSGFELTVPVEKLNLQGKTVYSIEEGIMLICLEKELTHELIKAIAEKQPSRVICLDEGFQNNDSLKTNAVLIMQSKGVENFRTV